LEKLFLAPQTIQEIMHQTAAKLTVLSGGEPFEHPQITEILTEMAKQPHPFRIATGGFVDLSPWIEKLLTLSLASGALDGVSMGTDVLSSRVDHSQWVQIWKENIRLLSKFQIPYSLTLTLGGNLDFIWLNLWKWTDSFDSMPEFIYLRYSRGDLLEDWIHKLQNTFGEIPIVPDEFSS
jgi:hypothetical protein